MNLQIILYLYSTKSKVSSNLALNANSATLKMG